MARYESKAGTHVTAAIFFIPRPITTAGPKLMGRNAAGESFLRVISPMRVLRSTGCRSKHWSMRRISSGSPNRSGRSEPISVVTRESLGLLAEVGAVYHPGPGIGTHACQRAACGHGAWSLCGHHPYHQ